MMMHIMHSYVLGHNSNKLAFCIFLDLYFCLFLYFTDARKHVEGKFYTNCLHLWAPQCFPECLIIQIMITNYPEMLILPNYPDDLICPRKAYLVLLRYYLMRKSLTIMVEPPNLLLLGEPILSLLNFLCLSGF